VTAEAIIISTAAAQPRLNWEPRYHFRATTSKVSQIRPSRGTPRTAALRSRNACASRCIGWGRAHSLVGTWSQPPGTPASVSDKSACAIDEVAQFAAESQVHSRNGCRGTAIRISNCACMSREICSEHTFQRLNSKPWRFGVSVLQLSAIAGFGLSSPIILQEIVTLPRLEGAPCLAHAP
jgi:hypothetical protein